MQSLCNPSSKPPGMDGCVDEVVSKLNSQTEQLICELTESAKDELGRCIESLTGRFAAKMNGEIKNMRSR